MVSHYSPHIMLIVSYTSQPYSSYEAPPAVVGILGCQLGCDIRVFGAEVSRI